MINQWVAVGLFTTGVVIGMVAASLGHASVVSAQPAWQCRSWTLEEGAGGARRSPDAISTASHGRVVRADPRFDAAKEDVTAQSSSPHDTHSRRHGVEWVHGRLVVITGPTSGIGRQIARDLGRAGARLVLACRDLQQGDEVAAGIAAYAPPPVVMPIDASSQRAIRAFAAAYRARFDRLDVLVNNAGISISERRSSADGIELTFATNVLGYQLLTLELVPLLKASAPARIINVASAFAGHLDLDDLQFERRGHDGLQAYAQSKACNRLLTWAIARRLEGTGVTANAMAPGFVQTGLTRNLSPELQRLYRTRVGRPVEAGADTAVWLAASREVEGVTGRFFMDRRELPCEFRDPAVEERLWAISDALLTSPRQGPRAEDNSRSTS